MKYASPTLTEWRRRFPEANKVEPLLTEIFPRWLDEDATPQPSEDEVTAAVFHRWEANRSARDALSIYVQDQEYRASRRVLEIHGPEGLPYSLAQIDQLLSKSHKVYETEIVRLDTLHRTLLAVPTELPDWQDKYDEARRLGNVQRYGPAIKLLKELGEQAAAAKAEVVGELGIRIDKAWSAAKSSPDPERIVTLLEDAKQWLKDGRISLAGTLLKRVEASLNGDPVSVMAQASGHQDPGPFPGNVTLSDVKRLLEADSLPSDASGPYSGWVTDGLWRQGRRPGETNLVLAALRSLELVGQERVIVTGTGNAWTRFLRAFFNAVGLGSSMGPSLLHDLEGSSPRDVAYGESEQDAGEPWSWCHAAHLKGRLKFICWRSPMECPSYSFREGAKEAKLSETVCIAFTPFRAVPLDIRGQFSQHFPNMALIDEVTVLKILCAETTTERLNRFLAEVAMQVPNLQAVNPFQTRNGVAPHMFFGRDGELTTLDRSPAVMLYGGRRLGKSSLLQEHARRLSRRTRHLVALASSEGKGRSPGDVKALVRDLRDTLAARDDDFGREVTLPRDNPQDFITQLKKFLNKHRDASLSLLIDEADMFVEGQLEAEVGNNSLLPEERGFDKDLRGLSQLFGNRFQCIFAGYQSIKRAYERSSTWGNWGELLVLGPMSEAQSKQFVINTLPRLGVQFSDPALVDLIVSRTNGHPDLLQALCRRLFERARSRQVNRGVHVIIDDADVESLFLSDEYQEDLYDCIALNVEGPSRARKMLRVVLYAIVQGQISGELSSNSKLFPSDLDDLLNTLFGVSIRTPIDYQDLRGCLADLRALGVLKGDERSGFELANEFFAFQLRARQGGRFLSLAKDILSELNVPERSSTRRIRNVRSGTIISPFTTADENRWLSSPARVTFLVGSGEKFSDRAAEWFRPEVLSFGRVLSLHGVRSPEEVVARLAGEFELPKGTPLSAVKAAVLKWVQPQADTDGVRALIVKDADAAVGPEFLDLWFKEFDGTGLLDCLDQILQEANSRAEIPRLRVFLAGSYRLARFLAEWMDVIGDKTSVLSVRRLQVDDLPSFLQHSHLLCNDANREKVWNATKGDWRLLEAFRTMAFRNQDREDVRVQAIHLNTFQSNLTTGRDLHEHLQEYPEELREALAFCVNAAVAPGNGDTIDEDWIYLCLLPLVESSKDSPLKSWTPSRWKQEIRALQLLDELAPSSTPVALAKVRLNDPWLSILERYSTGGARSNAT